MLVQYSLGVALDLTTQKDRNNGNDGLSRLLSASLVPGIGLDAQLALSCISLILPNTLRIIIVFHFYNKTNKQHLRLKDVK